MGLLRRKKGTEALNGLKNLRLLVVTGKGKKSYRLRDAFLSLRQRTLVVRETFTSRFWSGLWRRVKAPLGVGTAFAGILAAMLLPKLSGRASEPVERSSVRARQAERMPAATKNALIARLARAKGLSPSTVSRIFEKYGLGLPIAVDLNEIEEEHKQHISKLTRGGAPVSAIEKAQQQHYYDVEVLKRLLGWGVRGARPRER